MSNFAAMIERVKRDLNATKGHRLSDDDVRDAINDAIADYETQRFTFNEGSVTLAIQPGVEAYDMPANVIEIDEIQYLNSARSYRLRRFSYREFVVKTSSIASFSGWTTHYAIQAEKIHFYPKPNSVESFEISGLLRLDPTPLDNPVSSNAWTDQARRLIRAKASWDLAQNRLHNPDLASSFELAERKAHHLLRRASNRVLATGQSYAPTRAVC